ncbi:MAG: hypothetical protein KDA34_03615 [Phycisphaerales bacterium]|nr:hypothetical protein [Phycisphaerales bacterium]
MDSASRDSYDICPVCGWEDDPAQFVDPDLAGGANSVSLEVAWENFTRFGACDTAALEFVRKPLPEELP